MSVFKSGGDPTRLWAELEDRKNAKDNLRKFGISFLDEALLGIRPADLILLGASSGMGKTQLCCNIALANIEVGRRVHFIALEAEEYEIERRLKYQIVAKKFFEDFGKYPITGRLSFSRWLNGDFYEELASLEVSAIGEMEKYKDLWIHYKPNKFGLQELCESVIGAADDSDLFIIDHAHYFDVDEENENKALKQIAKTCRRLSLEESKPIILVAHLRKKDRNNGELVPGLDEFHGSSDLFKIATRVITIAPGARTEKGNFETFMRIPKNRFDGETSRFIARMIFNAQKGNYETDYRLGPAYCDRENGFKEISAEHRPEWAKQMVSSPVVSSGHLSFKRDTRNYRNPAGSEGV